MQPMVTYKELFDALNDVTQTHHHSDQEMILQAVVRALFVATFERAAKAKASSESAR